MTALHILPAGPVCFVTSNLPNILLTKFLASSGLSNKRQFLVYKLNFRLATQISNPNVGEENLFCTVNVANLSLLLAVHSIVSPFFYFPSIGRNISILFFEKTPHSHISNILQFPPNITQFCDFNLSGNKFDEQTRDAFQEILSIFGTSPPITFKIRHSKLLNFKFYK